MMNYSFHQLITIPQVYQEDSGFYTTLLVPYYGLIQKLSFYSFSYGRVFAQVYKEFYYLVFFIKYFSLIYYTNF